MMLMLKWGALLQSAEYKKAGRKISGCVPAPKPALHMYGFWLAYFGLAFLFELCVSLAFVFGGGSLSLCIDWCLGSGLEGVGLHHGLTFPSLPAFMLCDHHVDVCGWRIEGRWRMVQGLRVKGEKMQV
jgi:hypothetical protein